MRTLCLCVVATIVLTAAARADPINAVIGDRSWTAARPPDDAPEALRIRTHLAYVRAQLGRTGDAPARTAALRTLDDYIARGEFPRRTGDGYAGRRPRFIDDRGVHCAVGHLIAASGQPELARAINDRFEYALVSEMDSPELRAWAATHGFTVDELAMIQPGYDPHPTEATTREKITAAATELMMHCATRYPPTASVTLRIVGDRRGSAVAVADSTNPFDACFASAASQLVPGRVYYEGELTPYAFAMTVAVPSAQPLFDKQVAALVLGEDCTPRPGAIPATVTFELTGTAMRAITSPSNAEVDRCLAASAREQLRDFVGMSTVRATRRMPLASRLAAASLRQTLGLFADITLARCYPAKEGPSIVTVRLTAKRDDARFTVTDDSGLPAYSACIRTDLEPALRKRLAAPIGKGHTDDQGVWHDPPTYFRIDTDVDVSATLTVDLKAVEKFRSAR